MSRPTRRPSHRGRHAAWSILWLTFVWVALWRDLSWGTIAAGVIAAAVVLTLFPVPAPRWGIRVRPLAMAKFLAVFGFSVIKGSVIVAWKVLTPQNPVEEGIIGVQLSTDHPVLVTTINHAVTLAPGTMVIDIAEHPSIVYVHVLDLTDASAIRADVRRLERLALAAYGLDRSHHDPDTDRAAR